MDTRIILLLSLSVYFPLVQAQSGYMRCVCRRFREKLAPPKQILDIQILPPSPYCDKLEIVVIMKNGLQFCLNPKHEILQRIFQSLKIKLATHLMPISPSDEFEYQTSITPEMQKSASYSNDPTSALGDATSGTPSTFSPITATPLETHLTQNCTCRRTCDRLMSQNQIRDIQILLPRPTCDSLEIVVITKSGLQCCTDDPKVKKVFQSVFEMEEKSEDQLTTISPSDGFEYQTSIRPLTPEMQKSASYSDDPTITSAPGNPTSGNPLPIVAAPPAKEIANMCKKRS